MTIIQKVIKMFDTILAAVTNKPLNDTTLLHLPYYLPHYCYKQDVESKK